MPLASAPGEHLVCSDENGRDVVLGANDRGQLGGGVVGGAQSVPKSVLGYP